MEQEARRIRVDVCSLKVRKDDNVADLRDEVLVGRAHECYKSSKTATFETRFLSTTRGRTRLVDDDKQHDRGVPAIIDLVENEEFTECLRWVHWEVAVDLWIYGHRIEKILCVKARDVRCELDEVVLERRYIDGEAEVDVIGLGSIQLFIS